MNGLGKQLLACSALPFDQHSTISLRYSLGKGDLSPHMDIICDDLLEPVIRLKSGQLIDLFAHLPSFPDRERRTENPAIEGERIDVHHTINLVAPNTQGAVRIA
ncbi:hypothetical protein D3C81_1727930 [compost metagenome]